MNYLLLDVSGWIPEKMLDDIVSKAIDVMGTPIHIIPWDTRPRPGQTIHDIKDFVHSYKAGGGSILLPTIKHLESLLEIEDSVMIASDGYIYDTESTELQQCLSQIKHQSIWLHLGDGRCLSFIPGWNIINL